MYKLKRPAKAKVAETMYDLTGIILSGGNNIRMGENKAFIELEGRRIIDRTVALFGEIFKQTILVTNEPLDYSDLDLEIVVDLIPKSGSLIGIYTGLFYSSYPHCFVTACDMPFINKRVIDYIVTMKEQYDVVIPHLQDGYHPLFARYSKRCMEFIEKLMDDDKLKISNLFNKVKVREVLPKDVRLLDPSLKSFCNLNTPKDLEEAKKL